MTPAGQRAPNVYWQGPRGKFNIQAQYAGPDSSWYNPKLKDYKVIYKVIYKISFKRFSYNILYFFRLPQPGVPLVATTATAPWALMSQVFKSSPTARTPAAGAAITISLEAGGPIPTSPVAGEAIPTNLVAGEATTTNQEAGEATPINLEAGEAILEVGEVIDRGITVGEVMEATIGEDTEPPEDGEAIPGLTAEHPTIRRKTRTMLTMKPTLKTAVMRTMMKRRRPERPQLPLITIPAGGLLDLLDGEGRTRRCQGDVSVAAARVAV